MARPTDPHGRPWDERGSISVLVIGALAVAIALILGAVIATSAQLSRVQLLDVVDAAALDAADAFDQGAYHRGLASAVPLSSATVRESADLYLAARERPARVTGWRVESGTGTPDGQTAVVVIAAEVDLPVVGIFLGAISRTITMTVQGSARADLVG
ncbi:MAG: hypothetical protein Q4G67_09025 [Actinomycetia bacterium]|nr:hypothetical protein [Actinomycetes bacterium]